MSTRLAVRTAAVALAMSAMIGGPVAAASASNFTIKLAVVRASPGLRHRQTRLRRALRRYKASHRAAPVIRAIRAQDRDLSALRSKVRRSSASSRVGARARREIITGLGLVLRSNYAVSTDLRRRGPFGLTPTQARRAARLATRGDALYRRGVLLLARS